jgi:hypothetical protein
MATFTCPDCKTKVSTSAANCPKCGRPVTEEDRTPKKKSWLKRGICLSLVLFLVGWVAHELPRVRAEQQAANEAYKAKVVTVDNQVLQDKVLAQFDKVIFREAKRVCKKAGMPEPKGCTLNWVSCKPGDYEVWVEFDGGIPAKKAQSLASMTVGHISGVLADDLKVTSEQLHKEDTYISAFIFSKILGKTIINGGIQWHIGKEGETPFWLTPADVKKYKNL